METSVRFLIIDDHATVLEGLVHLLSGQFPGAHFRAVATAEDALAAEDADHFEIIILDLNLSGRNGLSLIPKLKAQNKKSHLLVHTMHQEDQFGILALRAGADGYLTKDRPVQDLFHAINRLLEGKRFISDFLIDQMADAISRESTKADSSETLSGREREVLRLLSSGKSASMIAKELDLSIKTVSTYRTRMLEKMGLQTTADLIRYGISHKLDVLAPER